MINNSYWVYAKILADKKQAHIMQLNTYSTSFLVITLFTLIYNASTDQSERPTRNLYDNRFDKDELNYYK